MFKKKTLAKLTVLVVLSLFAATSTTAVTARPLPPVIPAIASGSGDGAVTPWKCSVPKGSSVAVIGIDTPVFFNPNTTDRVGGITLKAGSKWYIIGQTGNYFKLSLVASCVYVLTSTVQSVK